MRILLLFLLLALPAYADEGLDVTPVPRDTIVRWAVDVVHIERGFGSQPLVHLRVVGLRDDGQCARADGGGCVELSKDYRGEEALTLMNALNTANLTTNSLSKRILERLRTDGVLGAGSVSGNPGRPTWTPTITPTPVPTATATEIP